MEQELGRSEDHDSKVIRGKPNDGEGKINPRPVIEDLAHFGSDVNVANVVNRMDEMSSALIDPSVALSVSHQAAAWRVSR